MQEVDDLLCTQPKGPTDRRWDVAQQPERAADLIFEIPILKSSRLTLWAIRADDYDHLMAMSHNQDPENRQAPA
jgi:hypothetical protein